MQPELHVRKILGRTYLNENKLSEALEIFIKILMDYPEDLETLLIVAGFYLAAGDGRMAKSMYRRAQELDPGNKIIERQILLAEELEGTDSPESIPTDIHEVSRLLQRLTGMPQPVPEADILRAATLLDTIITSESPADLVAAHLEEIDGLLLALIEVNIRQARADGRTDVANALHSLQLNIEYQREAHEETPSISIPQSGRNNLLMLLPDLGANTSRMALLKPTLESLGFQVSEKAEYIPGRDPQPDLVITCNPYTRPALIESLSALSKAGVPILLDLDTDFKEQPIAHPDYEARGLSTQTCTNDYLSAISFADVITVPSQRQASLLPGASGRVFVIPDGWSRQNRLWEKAPAPHPMVNIGWVSSCGELEDLMMVRRFMIRIIREFPNTRVVIIGNPQAYRLFEGLPENRRLYLPLVGHDEFPYLLSQLDILLVPLRNQPNNLLLPDTILMQAGARGVPWIASPIPAFLEWLEGGILTDAVEEEWHLNLRHLVMDLDLRKRLGTAGREAARTREMDQLGKLWLEALSQLTNAGRSSTRDRQMVKDVV